MAVTTRFAALDRDIELLLSPAKSPEERSKALAEFAASEIAAASKQNDAAAGHQVPYDVAVDGSKGAALTAVKPDGRISAEWAGGLQGGVIDWIWQEVLLASPRLTGAYIASHRLLADGVEVTTPDPSLEADEWIVTTTVPYARKLEGMSGKRPPLSAQAPHGIYQVVAEEAKRRYGNLAAIKFSARSVEGGSLADWASRTKLSSKGHASSRHRRDWLTRQPAIVISFR